MKKSNAIIDVYKDILAVVQKEKTDVGNLSSESMNELEILQMTYL